MSPTQHRIEFHAPTDRPDRSQRKSTHTSPGWRFSSLDHDTSIASSSLAWIPTLPRNDCDWTINFYSTQLTVQWTQYSPELTGGDPWSMSRDTGALLSCLYFHMASCSSMETRRRRKIRRPGEEIKALYFWSNFAWCIVNAAQRTANLGPLGPISMVVKLY